MPQVDELINHRTLKLWPSIVTKFATRKLPEDEILLDEVSLDESKPWMKIPEDEVEAWTKCLGTFQKGLKWVTPRF